MTAAMLAVFLLPSTIAVYAAVNGTAWDLQDLQLAPVLELMGTLALASFALACPTDRVSFLLAPEVTHPVAPVPPFELDCTLIC